MIDRPLNAPAGQIWECQACGKLSEHRYGDGRHSHGWDESCMLNAALVPLSIARQDILERTK